MYPFGPFRVSCSVRFLVLWLEDPHNLAVAITGEVTPRAALRYHLRMHAQLDGNPDTFDYVVKSNSCHPVSLGLCEVVRIEGFGTCRPHSFRRLEDRMLNLQLLLFIGLSSHLIDLEFGSNFPSPSLQTCIDGFDVYAGRASPWPSSPTQAMTP